MVPTIRQFVLLFSSVLALLHYNTLQIANLQKKTMNSKYSRNREAMEQELRDLHKPRVVKNSTTQPVHTKIGNHPISEFSKIDRLKYLTGTIYVPGFIEPQLDLCPEQGLDVRLIIIAASSYNRYEHRQTVRRTWGSFGRRRDIKLGFIVGKSDNGSIDLALENEIFLYRDIILTNNFDGYDNLTLKTLNVLEWVSTYCNKAKFLLKTDDDMSLNIEKLLRVLDRHKTDTRSIIGRLAHNWIVDRTSSSKYFMPHARYSDDFYPDFTTGGAYVVTRDVVTILYRTALAQPFLHLEDVFITGLVAQELGIKRLDHSGFLNIHIPLEECSRVHEAIAIHALELSQRYDVWYMMNDKDFVCPPPSLLPSVETMKLLLLLLTVIGSFLILCQCLIIKIAELLF